MNKYFAKQFKNQFGTFDSKTEFERYLVLLELQKEGKISDLTRQVRFEILPKLMKLKENKKGKIVMMVDEQAVHYTLDFRYKEGDTLIFEEVKSKATALARDYPLRRKLMKHLIENHNKSSIEKWQFREIK